MLITSRNVWPFSDFQYGFRSYGSTADLLTVASDKIAMTFNRSGLLELLHLIYPRLLTGFGMLVIFKRKSHGISVKIFGLISSCLSNRRLRVVLDGKFYQEYPDNGVVFQGSILGPTLLLLSIFIILSITLLSMLMVLLSTLSVIRHLICGNN